MEHFSSIIHVQLNIYVSEELILLHFLSYIFYAWEYSFLFEYLFWNNS